MSFALWQYIDSKCMQFDTPLGYALYKHTAGNMCDGCSMKRDCISLRTLQKQNYKETVRDEAKRRNIGIKEVRRQRNSSK